MGDQNGGVQNFTDQYIRSVSSPMPQQAPPPRTAIPGAVAPPPPPDYSTHGAGSGDGRLRVRLRRRRLGVRPRCHGQGDPKLAGKP
jgi:hypothetical protein